MHLRTYLTIVCSGTSAVDSSIGLLPISESLARPAITGSVGGQQFVQFICERLCTGQFRPQMGLLSEIDAFVYAHSYAPFGDTVFGSRPGESGKRICRKEKISRR